MRILGTAGGGIPTARIPSQPIPAARDEFLRAQRTGSAGLEACCSISAVCRHENDRTFARLTLAVRHKHGPSPIPAPLPFRREPAQCCGRPSSPATSHRNLTNHELFCRQITSPANPTTFHPTRWSENQFRFTSLPSPPIGPSDAPLEEYSSFLAPLASFRLDGDDEAPASPTAASAPGPSSSSAAPLTPARREGSAHAMDVLVQSAFDEMDSALASAHDQRDPASGASTTDASPRRRRDGAERRGAGVA